VVSFVAVCGFIVSILFVSDFGVVVVLCQTRGDLTQTIELA